MMTKKEIDVVSLITLVDYKTVVYGNDRDEHIRAVAFYGSCCYAATSNVYIHLLGMGIINDYICILAMLSLVNMNSIPWFSWPFPWMYIC